MGGQSSIHSQRISLDVPRYIERGWGCHRLLARTFLTVSSVFHSDRRKGSVDLQSQDTEKISVLLRLPGFRYVEWEVAAAT